MLLGPLFCLFGNRAVSAQSKEPTGKKSWQGVSWVILGGDDALSLKHEMVSGNRLWTLLRGGDPGDLD